MLSLIRRSRSAMNQYLYMPAVLGVIFLFLIIIIQPAGSAGNDKWEETLLLISLDGFRWDYPEKTATPNLDRLIEGGVRAESLVPVFPSKTFPNHYSIVTGLYPENHGLVSNSMYDPELDDYYSLGDRNAVSDSRWYGGEPLWVTAEKQGKIATTYFWPGSEAAIQGIRPTFWKEYDGRIPNEQRIEQVLQWLDLPVEQRPAFITLYFSDADDKGHRHGPDSPEIMQTIRKLDNEIGLLFDGLKSRNLLDKINIIVLSDHGMTAVSRDKVIFLDDYVSLEDTDIIDWSPILSLRPKPGKEEQVYQALKDAHPKLQVYKKADIPERFHYRNHRRIMPVIGIMAEGWSVSSREYFESRQRAFTGGTHGYDNQLPSMHGIFIAAGPAFKAGITIPTIENIHLYELFCHILQLQPAANDGNLEAVHTFLK